MGIRLAGLKSAGLTSANAQNTEGRDEEPTGGCRNSCSLKEEHSAQASRHRKHTLRQLYLYMRTQRNIQKHIRHI